MEKIAIENSPELEQNLEKQRALEHFRKAVGDLNAEVRLAIPQLLSDIQIVRKTDDENILDAFNAALSTVEKRSFTNRNVSDRRSLDSLAAIIQHEDSLVGKNLTLAEVKEFFQS